MKKLFILGILCASPLLASSCGGPTTGSTPRTGEITPEQQAAIDANDKAVEEAEMAHSSGK